MNNPTNRQVVIVAGDSHSNVYNGRVCIHRETGTEMVTIAANVSGQAAAAVMTTEDGTSFHQELIQELGKALVAAKQLSNRPPQIVLTLGGPDTVLETTETMWGEYDFILPGMPQLTDRTKRCIQFEIVKGWLARRLSLFERALDLFKAQGIEIAAILPQPPAYRSNRKFHEMLVVCGKPELFVAPFPVRAKMSFMTRCYLAELAARRGIRFVDTWPILVDGLFLKPEHEFDGLHVSLPAGEKLTLLLCSVLANSLSKAA